MAVNWSEPKIQRERVKIDPWELIATAEKHFESGDYYSAERTYVAAIKNSKGTISQAELVTKAKKGLIATYEAWAIYCVNKKKYEEAEQALNKELKVNPDIRNVKADLRFLYTTWGDDLKFEGKLAGAETRYILALQMDKELNDEQNTTSALYKKIKEIEYLNNSHVGKEYSRILYVLEQGEGYNVKATVLCIIGLICICSALWFHGNDDVFWIILLIMFLSPIGVAAYSFTYERLITRGHGFIAFVYMFSWSIIGGLFCAKDPLYAFYPAVAGLYFVSFSLKMKVLYRNKKTPARMMSLLSSRVNSNSNADITVTHTAEDEKMENLKASTARAAGLGVRLLIKSIFR